MVMVKAALTLPEPQIMSFLSKICRRDRCFCSQVHILLGYRPISKKLQNMAENGNFGIDIVTHLNVRLGSSSHC